MEVIVLVRGRAWGVGSWLAETSESRLEYSHLLVGTLALKQEVTNAILEGRLLAVEARG